MEDDMNSTTSSKHDNTYTTIEIGISIAATIVIVLGILCICYMKRTWLRRRLSRCTGKRYRAASPGLNEEPDGDGFIDDSPFSIGLEAGASEYVVDQDTSDFDDDPIYVADLRSSRFEEHTAMHIEDEAQYEDDDLGLGN